MLQYPSGYPMPERFPVLRHVLASHKDQGLTRQKTRTVAPIGYVPKKVRQRDAFGGTVRMLVLALDYKGSGYDLTCTVDGDNMQDLARASGVQDLTVAYNGQCTPVTVRELIQAIGSRCQPHDTFILNFSGHGTSVTDTDGDEEDLQDEAYVLVDETGQMNLETALMTDDELSELLLASIPKTTKILVISDCCHSGTILDFSKPCWRGRKALSISGCRDAQTSGDTGDGGICTHAILLAVESLQRKGETRYSVAKLFNETLRKDEEVFDSPQDITIDSAVGVKQTDIDWPLVPKSQYTAPHGQDASAGMEDGPAPANTYILHSSAAAPALTTCTNASSLVGAPAPYTNSSSLVAPASIYVTPSLATGNSCVVPPGTHTTHSIPGNYYHLPSITTNSISVSHASSPYVVTQNTAYSPTSSHYVAQESGLQPNPQITVSQPVYTGPCASQFANLGHMAHFTNLASHGLHPQVVTNFQPVGTGSMSLSPGPALLGNVPHMTYSTGVSVEEPTYTY